MKLFFPPFPFLQQPCFPSPPPLTPSTPLRGSPQYARRFFPNNAFFFPLSPSYCLLTVFPRFAFRDDEVFPPLVECALICVQNGLFFFLSSLSVAPAKSPLSSRSSCPSSRQPFPFFDSQKLIPTPFSNRHLSSTPPPPPSTSE